MAISPLLLPVWANRTYSDIDLLSGPEGIALGLLIVVIIVSIVLSHLLFGALSHPGDRRMNGRRRILFWPVVLSVFMPFVPLLL